LTGNGFALNSTGLKVANGTNSVTIDAANGRIIANAGTIGGWTLSDSLLSQNNARLSSTGYIELGGSSTDNIIRLDANDATYRMWIGRNSSTTAPFKVTKEGVLYATGAVLTNLEIGSTLSDGTSLTTVKTNAATGATALQPGGTLTGNVSGTVGGIAVATVTSGASSGASAIQPGNGVTLKNDRTIESIIAGTTLTLKSGGTKPVIINDTGLKMNDGTQDTLFLDASTGSAVFRGTVYASAGEFSGKVTAGSGKIGEWTISTDGYLSSSDTFFYPSTTPGGNASTYSFITTRGIGAYSAVIGDTYNTATVTALTVKGAATINGNFGVVGGSIINGSQGISSTGSISAGVGGFTTAAGLFIGQGAEFNSTIYANTLGVYTGTSAYAVRQVYAGGTGTNATGYLRVNTSSRKFKKEIEPLVQGKYLDLLTSLKPVSYLDRNEDIESPRAFGLIAEEVAEIPELKAGLVPRDADGNPGAVHYELVGVLGVMALKEIKEMLIEINSRLDALEA
jgi:hypothetical protein